MSERGAHIKKINLTYDELKAHIGESRVETGPIQIGAQDWPGIFIRGDSCVHYWMNLEMLLDSLPPGKENDVVDVMGRHALKDLIELLKSSAI